MDLVAPSAEKLGRNPDLRLLGRQLSVALFTQDRWIIRTVERVSFVDRNTVRRRLVRHFVLPAHKAARPISGGACILPVFSIRKAEFISCDLRDAGDRRIALPPIQERWRFTWLVAMAALSESCGPAAFDGEVGNHIWEVISAPRDVAPKRLAALRQLAQRIRTERPGVADALEADAFDTLATYLSHNFLVFAGVPTGGDAHSSARMISYSIDQRFPSSRADFREADMRFSRRGRMLRYLGLAPHTYLHSWGISGAG